MHPRPIRVEVLARAAGGENDSRIARSMGLPRTTVRDIRRAQPRMPRPRCPRCWWPGRTLRFTAEDYAELLGLYLGDGHISEGARTARLRIALDGRYRRIVNESEALLRRCFPRNSVGRQLRYGGRMVVLSVYSRHLPCLFPQHGPGVRHSRSINLEQWQEEIVSGEPWPLLRGLIRSDGCSFVNRTGPHEYLSFEFFNCSEGIVRIFLNACEQVGVFTRVNFLAARRAWRVRIYRRESVALLLEHVGIKE